MRKLLMTKDVKAFYQILSAFVDWAKVCQVEDLTQMVPEDTQVQALFVEFISNSKIQM